MILWFQVGCQGEEVPLPVGEEAAKWKQSEEGLGQQESALVLPVCRASGEVAVPSIYIRL